MKVNHLIAAAALLAAFGAHAQQAAPAAATPPVDHSAHHGGASAAPLSEGEVRKLDPAQGKVTLRHGPLTNLDMPAMTMVFTAVDKKLLEGVKEGDKVRFTADKKDGAYVVTALQVQR